LGGGHRRYKISSGTPQRDVKYTGVGKFSNEKALGETNSALAVVRREQKSFRPAADPLPGGAGRPKFNQLEMVTTFTYKPSLVRIDARNF